MRKKRAYTICSMVVFCLGLSFILFLNGAIPFVSLPTLGQAIWTTGFSQSFINNSLFSLYAENFGFPHPAAIAFGLAGAYPAGLFIAAGFHPADAYTCTATLWFIVAFASARCLARSFQVSSLMATLLAVLWLCLPIVWKHSGYSMVSMGIALLPFYMFACLKLFYFESNIYFSSLLYFISCLIAVFMDGYTFMMFATGASIFGLFCFQRFKALRHRLLKIAFPVHVAGFICAYIAFATYIGKPLYGRAPIDFFRGWGVDLTFLCIPTKGIHWLWDILNFSQTRSQEVFFGDASVWLTTFSLPLILSGFLGWYLTRKKEKLASAFFLIAVVGFYLALGPSLKINSVKPGPMGPLMPAEFAIISTGSTWIYEMLPGFNNMRAVYRWCALGIFGFWCLVVLLSTEMEKKRLSKILIFFLVIVLITSFLPNLQHQWTSKRNNRKAFFNIDYDLLSVMREDLAQGERVAFLPYQNDFLVNYLASRLKIYTYNIGGDKNLAEAKKHWPETMKGFRMSKIDSRFWQRIIVLLTKQEVDVVILPYIDMLWAAHKWPYPIQYKKDLKKVEKNLIDSSVVEVIERDFYSVVRLIHER